MTWSKQRNPKYATPEHRQRRAAGERQMRRDGFLVCVQPKCIEDSRTITPDQRWCVGHDDSGTVYIGPVHESCNLKDAAVRGHAAAFGTASDLWWDL